MKRMKVNMIFGMALLIAFSMMNCAIRPGTDIESGAARTNLLPESNTPASSEYLLGYGDVIEVKFFNSDQFNETLTVRPDGRISMQRVGDIMVTGKTATELSRLITDSYKKIISS